MTTPLRDTPQCPRFGKWWFGCKFEARYDKPAFSAVMNHRYDNFFNLGMSPEQIAASKPPTIVYVRDVCVRCGRTIERTA